MNHVIPSAAAGSAHHHPSAAFRPMPASVMIESQKHAVVWKASASMARLPRRCAARRFALASHRIAAIERSVSTIPTTLGRGAS